MYGFWRRQGEAQHGTYGTPSRVVLVSMPLPSSQAWPPLASDSSHSSYSPTRSFLAAVEFWAEDSLPGHRLDLTSSCC